MPIKMNKENSIKLPEGREKKGSEKDKYKKLIEIFDITKGKKVKTVDKPTGNSVPYLLIDTLRGEEPTFFTEDKNVTEAEETDILMVMDGANSGLVGSGLKGAVGSTIARLRPKQGVDNKYLSYFLELNFLDLNKDVRGTGTPHVKKEKLCNLELRYPSQEEQTLIVQEIEKQFTRLDAAVKSLKAVKNKLEVYRKSVLKAAFEGKLVDIEFNEKRIKDVALSVNYGTSQKAKESGTIPVIRMGNLQRGIIEYKNLKFYDSLYGIEDLLLEDGDILFNRTNSAELVGKTSIFKGSPDYDLVVFASYLIRIRPDRNKIIPEYLNYWMNSYQATLVKEGLKSQQVGQANINGTKLKNISFPYASDLGSQTQIIQEIESRFSVIDKLEGTVDNALLKAEQLRKSILKSAFEGKLVEFK